VPFYMVQCLPDLEVAVHLAQQGDKSVKASSGIPLMALGSHQDVNTTMDFKQYYEFPRKVSWGEYTVGYAMILDEASNNMKYQIYFTDGKGKQISDVQKIIADKTSENGQERTFRCSFNLKSLKYDNKEIYYLVIAEEGGEIKAQEEFQIDIALAVDDFDFFG